MKKTVNLMTYTNVKQRKQKIQETFNPFPSKGFPIDE